MVDFTDQIDDYSDGATGTLTGPNGEKVEYKVSGNVQTSNWGSAQDAARVMEAGGQFDVTFDQPVGNVSLYVTSADASETYYVRIDGEAVDLNELIADGRATLTTTKSNVVGKDGSLMGSGHYSDHSEGVLTIHIPVTSIGVEGDGTGSSSASDYFEVGFADTVFLPCFVAGTLIDTVDGPRPVERIQKGDLVLAGDAGPVPVLWTGQRHAVLQGPGADARLRPILIRAGALGPGLPDRDIRVSRQHRVLLRAANGAPGGDEVLVPAAKLVGWPGIQPDTTCHSVRYHHILLSGHDTLGVSGAEFESMLLGERAADLIGRWDLAQLSGRAAIPCRPILERQRQVGPRLAWHRRMGIPLYQPLPACDPRAAVRSQPPPPEAAFFAISRSYSAS